jgi:hypothetical protein
LTRIAARSGTGSPERRFPLVAWIAYFLIYFVVIEIALLPFELILGSNVLTILMVPVLEEFLKLYIARRHRKYAFFAIALFALMELVLVKGLLLIETPLPELPVMAAFVLLAFIFHLSTASVYARSEEWTFLIPVYGACLALHIAFNALDLVVFDLALLLATSAMLALAPVAAGSLISRHQRRKAASS